MSFKFAGLCLSDNPLVSGSWADFTGEFLALTSARLNGKEMIAAGLATHFVPSEIRRGRNRTLAECLKNEFRLTMNLLRSVISSDVYE
ncbi:hypothetical protein GW17_00043039, partial [Ensete ventricosum]